MRRWAAKADILVENFLPGALEKRGIGVYALRALNPRLVACSISGAGDAGPEAGAPGFDLLAQGATGLMSITGPAGGAPHKIGVALVDLLAGWAALAEILAALHARERDGIGAHVKTNLVSTGLAALVNVAGSALVTGREATRHGNAHAAIEPYRMFAAADGPFLLAVGTDRQFGILCERVIGRPELARDARFSTNAARVSNRTALVPILEEILRGNPGPRGSHAFARPLFPPDPCSASSRLFTRRRRAASDRCSTRSAAADGAHRPSALLPRRIFRSAGGGPASPRRGRGEALRRGRPLRAALVLRHLAG